MKRLIIAGAGNVARELLAWLPGMRGFYAEWTLGGILTLGGETLRERGFTEPILGEFDNYQIQPDDLVVVAIGSPQRRCELAAQLSDAGAAFATLIHETVLISQNVTIGAGTIVFPRAVISCDARIGRHVLINLMATVGHDTQIGDASTLSAHCDITGNVELGRGVFMGSHATVLPNVKIGDFAVLGAGSAVTRNIGPSTTVMGVPGKKLPAFNGKSDH